MRGTLCVYCRSPLIRGEVRREHVCSSSYESHLALSSSVIYAFDNNNPEMLSTTTKSHWRMTTIGHLSVWRWKDVLLGGCLFGNFDKYFLSFCFVYLSLYVSLYLIKCYWWSKMCSGVSFPFLTECLPQPMTRQPCASLARLQLLLYFLVSYSELLIGHLQFPFLYFTMNLLRSLPWVILFIIKT